MPTAVTSHRYFAPRNGADPILRAKTVCTSHVLAALGVDSSTYHYSGTERQMLAIARRKWSLRSVRSKLARKATVGGSRDALRKLSRQEPDVLAYVVFVKGHVLLVSSLGETMVDTDPRLKDSRAIRSIYAVRSK